MFTKLISIGNFIGLCIFDGPNSKFVGSFIYDNVPILKEDIHTSTVCTVFFTRQTEKLGMPLLSNNKRG